MTNDAINTDRLKLARDEAERAMKVGQARRSAPNISVDLGTQDLHDHRSLPRPA